MYTLDRYMWKICLFTGTAMGIFLDHIACMHIYEYHCTAH